MSKKVKLEEFTPLAVLILKRFEMDQDEIVKRFPRLDALFIKNFKATMNEVKILDKELVLKNDQEDISDELYLEADAFNTELNYLSRYLSNAELDTGMVWALKKSLIKGNFDEAILKIDGLKQFIVAHHSVLESEGMHCCFPEDLEAYKISLGDKNYLHIKELSKRKPLKPVHQNVYASLSAFISTISYAGKVVFNGTLVKREYNINKIISKLRTPKHSEVIN